MNKQMMTSSMNRKTATKLLLINWSRFQRITVRLEDSTLFTGVNGSGKSTILDAMTYLLTGNTQFNKAAKDRDRSVTAYVRGDTKSNGEERFLRTGPVVSYVAMEFWSPTENMPLVVGVGIESTSIYEAEVNVGANWFICADARLEDINFSKIESGKLYVTPVRQLVAKGKRLKGAEIMGRDKGTEQILRTLGLRCEVKQYRAKLLKMMAFNPENNINQFIQESVLEPGKVNSLQELREQKAHFEQLRQAYKDLEDGKRKLEDIEQKTQEYEKTVRMLGIRELMLIYQGLQAKEEEKNQELLQQEQLKQRLRSLEQQEIEIKKQLAYAQERLQAAEANDMFSEMKASIQILEKQLSELEPLLRTYETETAKLLKLQKLLTGSLQWLLEEGIAVDADKQCLATLGTTAYTDEQKSLAFQRLCKFVNAKKDALEEDRVHFKDEMHALDEQKNDLEEQLARLEANILLEPRGITEAKAVIARELAKRGITTEVRTFAELVQDIRDEKWRLAIETFLSHRRHHILVEGKYCQQALEILHEHKLAAGTIVLTDKLPESKVVPQSAAEQLVIPNIYARRYANYLLNGIHLCHDLRELHDHPKGGLMQDGTLAKSYAVSLMHMQDTRVCLGSKAISLQKQRVLRERKELEQRLAGLKNKQGRVMEKLVQLDVVSWKLDEYQFAAPRQLEEYSRQKQAIEQEMATIKANPDYFTAMEEHDKAKAYLEEVVRRNDINQGDQGGCKRDIEEGKKRLQGVATEIHLTQQRYEEQCLKHLEWKRPMLEEYTKFRNRLGTVKVIKENTVTRLRSDLDTSKKKMEDAQLAYCQITKIDMEQRGPAYIPFYREQYRNLANVKIEKVRNQLEEQSKRLESAFMNDFVAEINETIIEARLQIDAINQELKQLPFGNDTYRFVMKEKAERKTFFQICRRLGDYMDSPELYMNSLRDNEEMERDIQEFMNVILEEEDEMEYTDYRKYFDYDMEIISRQGGEEITADLSKKQGSASNGEKQTPYFIILAACLMQYYPRNKCCARLAFIDEAFSALSRERIEQMVKYFESNGFQVIYAAPPEKISSIGQFIDCTVSLVMTGRYTNVVEGLIRQHEI